MAGISVIICSFNGGETIVRVLQSLQAQEGLAGIPVEIILVDNASTDGTAHRAAKAWTHPSIPFRVVLEPEPGLSYARRAGYRAAHYSLIFWIDDDNFVAPNYLRCGFDLMQRFPQAGMCGGCGEADFQGDAPSWFPELAGAFALGPQGTEDGEVPVERGFLYGAGAIIRHEALDELDQSGFPFLLSGRRKTELTSGEDMEVCQALRLLGWSLIQSRALKFRHFIPRERLTWEYVERLFHGFGRSDAVRCLYKLYLKPDTFRNRLQKLFPRAEIRRELNRVVRRDRAYFDTSPENELSARLRLCRSEGRNGEVRRLQESGELWRFLELIRAFAKRSRHLRTQRERSSTPEKSRTRSHALSAAEPTDSTLSPSGSD